MRLPFALLLTVLGIHAANIPITVVGSTQTQITISYKATTAGSCFVTATDNNNGPAVADLAPALYTLASTDLSRTIANGYRWWTDVGADGLWRTVTIGGHDEIKTALDSKRYSTALQVNSDHTINVSCNGGADTGSTHAKTANLQVGSYYPESLIVTPGSPLDGMPQPTIDWSRAGRNTKYVDPITGVIIQRVSGGDDSFVDLGGSTDNNPRTATFMPTVLCSDGTTCAAWTTPNNFITSQVAGTLATTSTLNNYVFAAFDSAFVPATNHLVFSDILVIPYGTATAHTETVEYCLTTDSGQTCANYTPIDVVYSHTGAATIQPTASAATSTIPSATPSPNYSGWGGMSVAFGAYDMTNLTYTGINASSSVVTFPSVGAIGFNLDRVPGSKLQLSSCGTGADIFLTVAHVDSISQITVQEAGLAHTNCTYKDYSVGLKAFLKTAGTVNMSVKVQAWQGRSANAGSNGAKWICARSKVTDIGKDCNGVVQSPPLSGYLCGLAEQGVYLVQDNGVMCLQGNLYGAAHLKPIASEEMPPVSNKAFLLPDFGTNFWTMTHTGKGGVSTDYTEYAPDPNHANADNFTYVNITGPNPIATQIAGAGGAVATEFAKGVWSAWGFDGVIENGSGGLTIQYRSVSGNQDSQCMVAWANAINNNLISSNALFGGYPYAYATCHGGTVGASGYSQMAVISTVSQLSPVFFSTTAMLGGPFTSNVTAMKKNGSFVTRSITTTGSGCTNANPTVCTSNFHDIDQPNQVDSRRGVKSVVTGLTGGWSPMNGTRYLHYQSNNTFIVYSDSLGASGVDATGFGSFSGQTATFTMSPALYSIRIPTSTGVTNSGGNARISADLTGGYITTYPSGALVVKDADPIAINVTQELFSTTQYYAGVGAHCSGCSASQFDVYSDVGLTTHVPFATLSSLNTTGGFAMYAETCPSQGSVTLPGPMYMDSTAWSGGTPKVRCVTLRIDGDFLSDYPKTGEVAAYPASGTGNSARSMMHQINVGDGFVTLRSNANSGNKWEIDYILSSDRTNFGTGNQIDVTVARNYEDAVGLGGRAENLGGTDYFANQHGYGWTAWAAAVIPVALINTNVSPNTYGAFAPAGGHSDFVPGATTGNVTSVNIYQPGSGNPDDKVDVTVASYTSTPATVLHNSVPAFANSPSYSLTSPSQSYPSERWRSDQASPLPVFKGDWMALNVDSGSGQNQQDSTGLTSALVNIRGSAYDPTNLTNIVYKVPVQGAGVNVKITPITVSASPHGEFVDISGSGALITDASIGSKCTAFYAGDCRPTSVKGDTFIAGRGWYLAGQCVANTASLGSPCAYGLWPGAGWMVQIRQSPTDTNASGVRRITQGFWSPLGQWCFYNWTMSPDAKWGFFAGNPIQQRPRHAVYESADWYAAKIPDWPQQDNRNGTTFMPFVVNLPGRTGESVRIAFGYGENGDPANLYCTSRLETCWTSNAPTAADPFVFAGETQSKTPCGTTGCSIPIPAARGRTLYYKVERTRSGGTTVLESTIHRVPIP